MNFPNSGLECSLILMLFSAFIFVPCVGQGEQGKRDRPVYIRRRTVDIAHFQEDGKTVDQRCTEQNVTYIVAEKRCAPNKYFYRECRSFTLTPTSEPDKKKLAITFKDERVKTISSESLTAATIVSTTNQAYANGSLCRVTSLEVYRGKQQSIPIESNGFIVSENGTFEITRSQLAYDFSEYEGELYRMNLSCSGRGLPNIGCLFFKFIGQTNLTEPKFNCTVPGTLHKYSTNCPPSMTFLHPNSSIESTTTKSDSKNSLAAMTTAESPHTDFKIDNKNLLLYILVPVGAIVGLLLCCLCVCAVILTCRRRRMKVSAITSREMERRISESSVRRISTERRISRERRISTASKPNNTDKEKGYITVSDDELNIYATPGAIMIRSNTYGCNCLEDNPAYQKPVAKSAQDAKVDEILECNYAIIPEHHNAGSRNRTRSGLETIITAHNAFYETSLNLKDQKKDCEVPVMSSRRSKPSQSLHHYAQ